MRVSQVVHSLVESEVGSFKSWEPDLGPERVAGHGGPACHLNRRKEEVVASEVECVDAGRDYLDQRGADPNSSRLVVLGVRLDGHPLASGGVPFGHFHDGLLHGEEPT